MAVNNNFLYYSNRNILVNSGTTAVVVAIYKICYRTYFFICACQKKSVPLHCQKEIKDVISNNKGSNDKADLEAFRTTNPMIKYGVST